jgi:hypothetical protein
MLYPKKLNLPWIRKITDGIPLVPEFFPHIREVVLSMPRIISEYKERVRKDH